MKTGEDWIKPVCAKMPTNADLSLTFSLVIILRVEISHAN